MSAAMNIRMKDGPTVACISTQCELIEIVGQPREGSSGKGLDALPRISDDGGLLEQFGCWMDSQDIYPIRLLTSGGGEYAALFSPQDAAKINRWLGDTKWLLEMNR